MRLLPRDNFFSPAALARFYLTMLIGLAMDLWSKSVAFAHLAQSVITSPDGSVHVDSRPPVEFLPGYLHFTVTANRGAVFGIGQGQTALFVIVSVIAIAVLTCLFAFSGRQRFYQFVLGLLLAGVLGNMYDRIAFGYVRDMIYMLPGWKNPFKWLYSTEQIFPWIFNVADVMLCVGVALMLLYSLFQPKAPRPAGSPTDPATAK